MTYLKNVSIYNMWGKEKVSVPLNKDVTILTGYNGSGKSTLLNIIYDSLVKVKNKKIPTSSLRFWAAKMNFSNGMEHSYACLPKSENIDAKDVVKKLEQFEGDVFSYLGMRFSEAIYKDSDEFESKLKFSAFKEEKFDTLDIYSYDGNSNFDFDPFIYQEDKKSLHKVSLSDKDKINNNIYWGGLDSRISHVRNKLYNRKSKLNKDFSDGFSSLPFPKDSEDFSHSFIAMITKHQKETKEFGVIEDVINKYLKMTNKVIQYDEDDNIYVAYLNDNNTNNSMWHELSRGEKTLIYLLLTVFLYKDEVKVFIFDEPEISLHIDWQDMLISDFVAIAPNSQFIIATHSPALVSNGWADKAIYVEMH